MVSSSRKSKPGPQYAGLGASDLAGFRTKGSAAAAAGGGKLADWEKYTTGIGSKLLKKMGYQPGKGLGPNLQGIATPVEVHKRQGRGAIGAYGEEKGQRLADTGDTLTDVKAKMTGAEVGSGSGAWRKGKAGGAGPGAGTSAQATKKKVKYVYRSVEEVIESGQNRKIDTIDLRLVLGVSLDFDYPQIQKCELIRNRSLCYTIYYELSHCYQLRIQSIHWDSTGTKTRLLNCQSLLSTFCVPMRSNHGVSFSLS